jgi:chitodextrinase
MEELYLDDFSIELPTSSIAITLQVNDMGELVNRQSNFSNTIKVPKSDNNVRAMKFLGVSGNTSIRPYRKIKAKYVVDGIELISKGSVQIVETSDSYSLRIYDGAVDFFDTIKGRKIRHLNFANHNHDLTLENVMNSHSKVSGYIYAEGAFYSKAGYTPSVNLKMPSFYVHTLFKMIVEQAGYSCEGSIFNDPYFKRKVVSMTYGYENNLKYQVGSLVANLNLSGGYNQNNMSVVGYEPPDPNDTFDGDGQIILYSGQLNTTGFTRLVLNGSFFIQEGTAWLYVKKGADVMFAKYYTKSTPLQIAISGEMFGSGLVEIGFYYSFSVAQNGNLAVNMNVNATGSIVNITPLPMPVNFTNMFDPSLQQIDFLKEIMQQFGLTFTQKKNSKHLIFKSNKDLLIDRNTAEDWSSKFSNIISESYESGYGRTNYFKYKYDSGVEPFADGAMVVDNENNAVEKDVISSIFTATTESNGYEVMNFWEIRKENEIEGRFPRIEQFRIFDIEDSIEPREFRYENCVGGVTYTGITRVLRTESMLSRIVRYYKEFKVMLDRYKKINVDLNLSLVDVNKIDFFKLKYFNQLGKYYYLNKIHNFIDRKSVKCELIEAPDPILIQSVDLIPPTNILRVYLSSVSDTFLTLNWTQSYDENGVVYEVQKDGYLLGTTTALSMQVTGLVPATQYTFRVRSKDPSGNVSAWKAIVATTTAVPADLTPPSAPVNLAVSNIQTHSALFTWTANTEPDLLYYEIEVVDNNDVNLGYSYVNSFDCQWLLPNKAYSAKVRAIDTSYNISQPSNEVNFQTSIFVRQFNISTTSYNDYEITCSQGIANVTRWHDGEDVYPAINDKIYLNQQLQVFNGQNKWWKIGSGNAMYSALISPNGVVLEILGCPLIGIEPTN